MERPPQFAIAQMPTPVLNEPDFRRSFSHSMPLEGEGRLLKTVETTALPHTLFQILGRTDYEHIVKVCTADYPYSGNFYVDERFLRYSEPIPRARPRLPSVEKTLQQLESLV